MNSRNILLAIGISDSLAAGCEYANENIEACASLKGYVKHPSHPLPPGWYTDDTQMSLANVEWMIHRSEAKLKKTSISHVVEYWLEAFHRDRRMGYAQGFYQFLCEHETEEEFLRDIKSDSDKSGAAMRAGVFGFCEDIHEAFILANWQAMITHNTVIGRNSAIVAALMVHYFRFRIGSKKDLLEYIRGYVQDFGPEISWDAIMPWRQKVKSKGYMHVAAAITALECCDSYSEILQFCCRLSGDTDTVAAIAMAAASQSAEIEPEIPDVLYETLENGQFGRDYLIKIGEELNLQYPGWIGT